MILREQAEEIFAWGVDYRTRHFGDGIVGAWSNHSRGAAEVAEKIAARAGLDVDRAYASGLLHDIGRYLGPYTGLNHIIDGYDLLQQKEMSEEIARICLTHSFDPQESVSYLQLDDKKREKFVKDYVLNVKYDDYDKLIQLADYMSGAHGVTTIERRFCSVIRRHGMPEPRTTLNRLYDLKTYFSKKVGEDIYQLFREKIMQTPFQGIPGDVEKTIVQQEADLAQEEGSKK